MPSSEHKSLLFLGTENDRAYLHYLKPYIGTRKVFVLTKPITTVTEIELYCNHPERNITGVISTSPTLLQKLTDRSNPSIDNYSGSYFKRRGIEYVFVDPLEQCITVPYGKFLLEHFTSKLTSPSSWLPATPFRWRILTTQKDFNEAYIWLDSSDVIAVDIETFKNPLSIRCIGYTGFKFDRGDGIPSSFSYVIPIDSVERLYWMRKLNGLSVPKVLQNGKYDWSYLARFDAPLSHSFFDTANAFHAWYAELPKDLGFLQAFFVREASYWKDLAESNDLETYYLYNAKDTWATVHVFLFWLYKAPEWAIRNYLLKFPVNFPAHMCEMRGIKRDMDVLATAREELEDKIEQKQSSLRRMIGNEHFNVGSPKQMVTLLKVLGCGDLESSDDKSLAKAAFRHPLNSRIIDIIRGIPKTDDIELMGIRAMRKAKSTYLRTDEDAKKNGEGGGKEFNGRILYAINPHGTDSGRNSSREHHFWCGLQIQNMPVGKTVKQTLVADDDFFIGEADLEQAETRDTAYITGDPRLIEAVESGRDFHSQNTAAFFGVTYESVYDEVRKKVLNKPLRNLAKRVNHGANYNMGPGVMVDTMGEKAIYEAAKLLGYPRGLSATQIAQRLLDAFARTYPVVRNDYQEWIIATVTTTHLLVGGTGWTRYCFGNPRNSKPSLNSYIAHVPQSLNAITLDTAFLRVFNDIAINPKYSPYFKLLAQIHDSILFQYHREHLYLPEMVRERMEIPITISDIRGVSRTFTVPAALKLGKYDDNGNLIRTTRWSDTE